MSEGFLSEEESSCSSCLSTKSQKEARLAKLNEKIATEKSLIQQLNINIGEFQSDILRFQNANKLFQYLKPSTIPEHTIELVDQEDGSLSNGINEEHENILKEKRDCIPPLRAEVAILEDAQTKSESTLNTLRGEYDNLQNEIVEYQEKVRFANSECVRSTRHLDYVNNQITERNNEIRMMEDLKREAQTALSALIERSENSDSISGGRLDLEKSIISLQNELKSVETEIAEVKERMNENKMTDEADIAEKQQNKKAHDISVNWEKEKAELKEELKELLFLVQQRKENLKAVEPKSTVHTFAIDRVKTLVKKWRGKRVSNLQIPENATIESMFAKLDEIKKEHDAHQKLSENEIAEIIVNNGRLQDEVNRRRKALERTVTQFHSDENTMRKKIDELREKAAKEEEKLLKQIESTKIKMAQRQLKEIVSNATSEKTSPAKTLSK